MIGFVAIIASLIFISYHEYMIYKNISKEERASNWKSFESLNLGSIFGSSQKIIDFISFVCLSMTLFDCNQNIL